MEMDKDIDMDEELTNPAKIRILGQVNALHGSVNKHPRGFFTAPFSCHVNEILIKDRMVLLLGQPILKATVLSSSVPVKTSSESEKSRFKKILEGRSRVGMADPKPADVPLQTSLESYNYTSPMAMLDNEVVLRRYENFKKFDIVEDHSDHLFAAHCSEMQQPEWLDVIKNEWRILEEHLPDTIFVRAYESRMDLLRAVIIGLEGTPYQDGLFIFDVFFPQNYPNSLPLVRYHSCGLTGINPVINDHTGVALNLFTADGKREMLLSLNMGVLQLLVLIQNLILNAKPYFNGFINASFRNSVYGEWSSLLYNENTIIKSLKTMVYTMNNPPKNFEDLVVGHFCKRARDILMECKAYMEGLPVDCRVTHDYEPCSIEFKNDVASCINPLIDAFKKIGAKEAQEFHYLAKKRKAEFEEDIDDTVNRKGKDTVSDDFLPWNIFADRDCVVTKVLIKCPMWVEKGQPLYLYDVTKLEKVITPQSTKIARSAINKVLMVNHKSRVGIFSMVDVFVSQKFNQTIPMARLSNESAMKRYENFKKFESVMDCSDHFFSEQSSAMNQPPGSWANKIREEWRILEESLPDTIFVRVYESRMDLLRAVIIGQEGTPYHGGLFFFDVCFPSDYPNSPPLVHYHSRGLAINPNLSKCGEVRLSLLQKSGGQQRLWVPNNNSTVLQLLVSMQKWIFNAKPLFNDLTYAIISNSSYGHQFSARYNENVRIKSLITMLYIMNKPPKNFEDFVPGYFCKHARDILTMACDQKPYSTTHKKDLYVFSQPLVTAFWNMGANKMQISFSKKK